MLRRKLRGAAKEQDFPIQETLFFSFPIIPGLPVYKV